jgi:hypothetical protein
MNDSRWPPNRHRPSRRPPLAPRARRPRRHALRRMPSTRRGVPLEHKAIDDRRSWSHDVGPNIMRLRRTVADLGRPGHAVASNHNLNQNLKKSESDIIIEVKLWHTTTSIMIRSPAETLLPHPSKQHRECAKDFLQCSIAQPNDARQSTALSPAQAQAGPPGSGPSLTSPSRS